MSLTSVAINRRVATVLLTLGLCAAGAASYFFLPVSPLPQVDFPTVSVSATLPGASPKTMASSVAAPLERSIGSIAGITEMTSINTLGSTRITVQFDLNRDINGASRDVQAAIDAAAGDLPADMPGPPTYRQVNPADAPVMLLALTSDSLRPEQLYDIASTLLVQKLSQLSGVGEVLAGGGSLPAVRLTVDTGRLHHYGLGLADIESAVRDFNVEIPLGAAESGGRYRQIAANDRAAAAADYAPLILAWRNGTAPSPTGVTGGSGGAASLNRPLRLPLRLEDVADVRDGVQDVHNAGFANGKLAAVLVIFRQPGANIISTVEAVQAALPLLRTAIPASAELEELFDRTPTIRASLRDVMVSLGIAVILVVLVVFFFLGEARATLVPGCAVTASLIITFAGMYLCGFSLNNLSLMALSVATGFVVDDAIVVLENISRHNEAGVSLRQAALDGAAEVSFTVVSISLSLMAVFIPILFMGGIVGRLFREFAVTMTLAVGVSLLLSLTLTPMLCSRALRAGKSRASPGRLSILRRSFLAGMADGYSRSLDWVMRRQPLMLGVWCAVTVLTVCLYIVVPKGFFPEQDTGLIRGSLLADESISFQALRGKLERLLGIVQADPAVAAVSGYVGASSGTAFVSITLKPRNERDATAAEVISRLRSQVGREPGAQLFMSSVQDINVGGRSSRAMYQYTLQGDDLDALRAWTLALQTALEADPIFRDLNNDLENAGLEAAVHVDRATAARLGVSMTDVDRALNNAFGQAQISTIYRERNQYRVVMAAESLLGQGPQGLDSVYVPGAGGRVVPLGALASFSQGVAPVQINHQGQSPAATLSFNLSAGASLSQAAERIEAARRDLRMPRSIQASFQGTAKEFERSLANEPMLILAALLCIYVVLGVLYESRVHPLTILSTLPPAGVGAILALRLCGMDFSVIALIGVLLLAGIVKKNAILLVDFALDAERQGGLTPQEGIVRACRLRFRPIMMTTMAAMLGAVPLAVGFGEGSELRRPLGVAIIGGLICSQALTLYTTPVVYLYMDRLRAWRTRRGAVPTPKPPVPPSGRGLVAARSLLPATALLLALSASLTLGLSGCAVGPDYRRPDMDAPVAYKEALSSQTAGNGDWVPARPGSPSSSWWECFEDERLNALMPEMERANQNLQAARANLRQARAQTREARAAFWPVLGASASASRDRESPGGSSGTSGSRFAGQTSSPSNLFTAEGQASWTPDVWGGTRRGVESAQASAEATAADLETTLLNLRAELTQDYFQLRTLDALLALYDDTVKAYRGFLRVTENQYKAGVADRSALARARSQLSTAEADRADLELQRRQMEHALAVLLGRAPAQFSLEPGTRPAQAPQERMLPPPPWPSQAAVGLPSTLLERRPDIAAAERRVAAANASIGVAQSAFFPSFTFNASGGFGSTDLSRWFSAPNAIWSIGTSLLGTLFDGGARSARKEEALAAWEATVAAYRQTALQAFQEVEDALAAARLLAEEEVLLAAALEDARDAESMLLEEYRAGTADFLDVATAMAASLDAARSLEQTRGARLAAAVDLFAALGGGWDARELNLPQNATHNSATAKR